MNFNRSEQLCIPSLEFSVVLYTEKFINVEIVLKNVHIGKINKYYYLTPVIL